MLDSEKEAIEFFRPYFDIFIDCINQVNKRYAESISADSKADFESRTHSTIWNDFMTKSLKRAFDEIFIPLRKYAQTTFICSGQYHLKTKKMDDSFRIKFTPTQLALEYLNYNIQLELNGILNPIMKIVLGIKLNKIRTEIEDVCLAYPNGEHSFLWIYKIEPSIGKQAMEERTSPDLPSSESYTNRQVSPKNIVEKKEDNERK
jgi:hypothetical protein